MNVISVIKGSPSRVVCLHIRNQMHTHIRNHNYCIVPYRSACLYLEAPTPPPVFSDKHLSYRIVPNKCTQRIDKHPDGMRRSRGAFWFFFQPILLMCDQFWPIFSEMFHHKVLGRIYFSRCIYLTLYSNTK